MSTIGQIAARREARFQDFQLLNFNKLKRGGKIIDKKCHKCHKTLNKILQGATKVFILERRIWTQDLSLKGWEGTKPLFSDAMSLCHCVFVGWLVLVLSNLKPEKRCYERDVTSVVWGLGVYSLGFCPVASHCWLHCFCFRLNLKHFSIRLRLMTIIRQVGAPSDRAICSDNTLGCARHNGNPALRWKNNEGSSQTFHAFMFYQ